MLCSFTNIVFNSMYIYNKISVADSPKIINKHIFSIKIILLLSIKH